MSEDGIVLLHRHASGAGWVEIGTAALDSPDLGAALAQLRDQAEAIEGPNFTTKLILPASQLLYATIIVDGDLAGDVEHALEERTPYTAAQLSYAISGTPPEVQVVAVARDTLAEAEGFIGPYGFNPVGFTTVPDPDHFEGEPNLGPMPSVGGAGLGTDDVPVRILSQDAAKALLTEQSKPAPASPEITEDTADDTPPAPKVNTVEVNAGPPQEPDLPVTPPAAFSSRRRPTLGPASQTGELIASRAPRIAVPTEELRKTPASKKPPKVKSRAKAKETAKAKPEAPVSAPIAPPRTTPPPAVAKAIAKTREPKPEKTSGLATAFKKGFSALRPTAKEAPVDDFVAPVSETLIAEKPDPIAELAARQAAGKPRHLGLILTAILIAALLLFAALSSYLLPDNTLARLLSGAAPEAEQASTADTTSFTPELETGDRLASRPEQSGDQIFTFPTTEEIAESETPEPEILPPSSLSTTEAEIAYAVSGIWQMAPDLRPEMTRQDLDDLYDSTLDPGIAFEDAPALASFDATARALDFTVPAAPPAASILFSLDTRGLVRPTKEGTLNPDGIMVFLGKPPFVPGPRPEGLVPDAPTDAQTATDTPITPEEDAAPVADSRLAGFTPRQRPTDLQERFERATLGGRTNNELGKIRPQIRPASAQAKARKAAIARALAEADATAKEDEARAAAQAAAEAELDKPTKQAVARSVRPNTRPRNFARVVARARKTTPKKSTPAAAASTAAISRATGPAVARSSRASPSGTTRASVARAATDNNAIALGKVSLVGVFGTSSNRRALVRMPNGRIKKVGVGDRVDGGRIAAIGESLLKYTKGGRTVTLTMPKG